MSEFTYGSHCPFCGAFIGVGVPHICGRSTKSEPIIINRACPPGCKGLASDHIADASKMVPCPSCASKDARLAEYAAEVERMKEELKTANEGMTVAHMVGYHKRDEEVRGLKDRLSLAESANGRMRGLIEWEPCPTCNGSGRVAVEFGPDRECTMCNGEGKTVKPIPADELLAALSAPPTGTCECEELKQYKHLLDEEVIVSRNQIRELNNIAAALTIYRHPYEPDQLANYAESLVKILDGLLLAILGEETEIPKRIGGGWDYEKLFRMASEELDRRKR
jgi:hypothetical protein